MLAGACALLWARSLRLAGELDRQRRLAAQQAAEFDRLRRADAAAMERLPDPLIVLDAARHVARSNAAARAAFGDQTHAVLRHPGLRVAIDQAYVSATPQTAELSLPVPIPREVQATVVPLDPPLADGGRAILVLSDRTRDRAVERMRADFVANAGHELRTPLASLIGFIETLRGPAADDPAAQARFLSIMAEQAGRMNRLIDDLLSLSRVELVEHQPPTGMVDLAALLSRVAAGFEPRLTTGAAALDLHIRPTTTTAPGDQDQLAQVMENLLDNAIKYGAGGPVRVELDAAPADGRWPSHPGLLLTVADRGPGIARQHLPRLTERFYRVDTARSRAVGGTGLGLAIVRHIVNRHRGRLLIESEQGAGTTVSVWLPKRQQPAGNKSETGRLESPSIASGENRRGSGAGAN